MSLPQNDGSIGSSTLQGSSIHPTPKSMMLYDASEQGWK